MKKLFLMLTLFVSICFMFGCGYNLEKAEDILKEEGYGVFVITEEELAKYQSEDSSITSGLVATRGLKTVTILVFKTSKAAEEFAEKADDDIKYILFEVESKGNAVIIGSDEDLVERLAK